MSGEKWRVVYRGHWVVETSNGEYVGVFDHEADARACVEAHNAAMTAPAERPDVRGKRVSKAVSVFEVATGPTCTFDPVAAAAELGEPDDDPVVLRATITAQAAEIEVLRKALATAERDRDEARRFFGLRTRQLETTRKQWVQAAKEALNGKLFNLATRVALHEAEPVEIILSNSALAPAAAEGDADV